jgi:hypothetical protein
MGYIYAHPYRDVDRIAGCRNIPRGLPPLGRGVQGSPEDQTLKVEHGPEIILRSDDNIRLSHRQRPENDVAKRHLPSRVVTPDPYANLDTLTARYVE